MEVQAFMKVFTSVGFKLYKYQYVRFREFFKQSAYQFKILNKKLKDINVFKYLWVIHE